MRRFIAQKSRGEENDFMLAMARGDSAEFTSRSSFVFRPGGTADPAEGVYITWTTLMAAVARVEGAKTIYVDDSIAAAHVTTVGAGAPWDIDLCTFIPNYAAASANGLIFDSGATVTFNQIWLDGGMTFTQAAGAASPAFALAAGGNFASINLRGQSNLYTIGALGAQPWATVGNGSFLSVMLSDNTFIGDGTHAAINALAGGTVIISCNGTTGLAALGENAIGGTGTLGASYSVGTLATQAVTTQTLFYEGIANTVQATGNTGTGSHTVTTTTGTIHKEKSGKVMVTGSCAGATAAADTITATLVRDVASANTTIATQTVTTTAGQLNYSVSFSFLDTLPDANNHTYSIRLAGAQNNTVAANQGIITAIEQ